MTTEDPIVIVGAARTPMGGFLGDFKDLPAHALGARAISAAVDRAHIGVGDIDEILMGCVLPAGQGQAPARQAAIGGRTAAGRGRDDDQQDVRFRHEGGDGRARISCGRGPPTSWSPAAWRA